MSLFSPAVIGLDISDHSIEAVLLLRKGGRLKLASVGRTVLPAGLVVGGMIEKPAELVEALRELLSARMRPPLPKGTNQIVLALPETQVYSHVFEVPRLANESELAKSLAIETDAYFPYNHKEMVASETTIGYKPDKKQIYYAAVHEETLKGFIGLCAAAGLIPVAIEPEASAIARAAIQPNEKEPVLLVDVGARTTNLSVFDRNGIHFSEAVITAGDAFDAAMATALGIAPAEAEERRKSAGFGPDLDPKAMSAARALMKRLAGEIRAAAAFYERRSDRRVTRTILAGGASQTGGFIEMLEEALRDEAHPLPVSRIDPWIGIDIPQGFLQGGIKDRGALMATSIGLALRGVRVRKFAELDFLPGHRVGETKPTIFGRLTGARTARPSAPPTGGIPHGLKLGLLAAGVLGLAVLTWAAAFRFIPALRDRGAAPEAIPPPAETEPMERTVDIPISLGATAEGAIMFDVVPIEVEVPFERIIEREGTETPGLAGGRVRLINETGANQRLIVRTRLLSEEGVLFRLTSAVTIPAGGEIEADVEADAPGAEGDIGPSRFSIPGLSASLQQSVYAVSDSTMTGGVVVQSLPLESEDLERYKNEAVAAATDALLAAAVSEGGLGVGVLRALFKVTDTVFEEEPSVGSTEGSVTIRGRLYGLALGFQKAEVDAALHGRAEGDILIDMTYVEIVPDFDGRTATFTLRATFASAPPSTPLDLP